MRITIEEHKCIAAGQCVLKAPMVYDQREEDGVVIILNDHPTGADQEAARLGARFCPADVIQIHED